LRALSLCAIIVLGAMKILLVTSYFFGPYHSDLRKRLSNRPREVIADPYRRDRLSEDVVEILQAA
jgi:hypothetical protein